MHRHCAPFLFSKRSPSQTKSARKQRKAPCPRKRRYAGPPRQRPRARPRLRQASARLTTARAALPAEAPLRRPAAPAPPVRVRAFVRHLRVSKQCGPPCPRKRRYASPPRQRPPVRVRAFVRQLRVSKRREPPCPRKRRYAGPPRQRPGRVRAFVRQLRVSKQRKAPCPRKRRYAGPPRQRPGRVRAFVRHLRVSKQREPPWPRKRRYAGPPRQRPPGASALSSGSCASQNSASRPGRGSAATQARRASAPPGRVRAFVRHLRVSKQREPPWPRKRRYAGPPRQRPPGRVRAFVRHLRVSKQRKAPCPRKRRYAGPPRQRPPGASALSSGGKAASTAPLASAPSPGGCVSPKARKAALSAKLSRRAWQGPRRRDGAEAPARRISARRTCWSFRKSDFRGWPDKSDSRRRNCSNQSRSAQGCGRRCSCAGRFDT